ncbi:MAG: outer membrane lipoprotein LolB [Rhodoferax sp.]|nr:outer membrane lipoprotein LolB [Rhodoferax sp.]
MKRFSTVALRTALLSGLLLLTACTSLPSAPPPATTQPRSSYWQGKLAVKVYSNPVKAFAANFELQGVPGQGELTLTSPLGTTLANMQWDANAAWLRTNGQVQSFASIEALAQQVTGADLPIASMFAWLEGRNETASGWQVDLDDLPQGRIHARHVEPVQAELTIILER